VDLIKPKPPSLSFSPAAIKHIQSKLKALESFPTSVNAAYERILDIFITHGQEKRPKNGNTAESWFRFLPSDKRFILRNFYSLMIIERMKRIFGTLKFVNFRMLGPVMVKEKFFVSSWVYS
jgi:hypothetical protein